MQYYLKYYITFCEVRKVKKEKKETYIKTKTRLDGGKEVIMTKSPSKTVLGKVFAITIAVLTILVPIIALIVVLSQHVQDVALTALGRQRTRRREGLVFGILEFALQFVDGNHVLLALIAEGDIDDGERDNHDKEPDL